MKDAYFRLKYLNYYFIMNKLLCCFLFIGHCLILNAQKVIYPGEFRCISLNGPMMNYWNSEIVQKEFTKDIDSLLLKKLGLKLEKNTLIAFKKKSNNNQSENVTNIIINEPQLNIDLIEYTTAEYIRQFDLDILDTLFVKEVKSVLRLLVNIKRAKEAPIFNSAIDIFIKVGITNGMGIVAHNLPFSSKGFTEVLKKSMAILLDSTKTDAQIEVKAARVFIRDNFILDKLIDKPRVQVTSKNNISKFSYNNQQQIIRWGEQLYQNIILTGKNKTALPDSVLTAIKKEVTADNDNKLILIQDARDVVLDNNYLMSIIAYLDFDFMGNQKIKIIKGNFNTLTLNKDTVARFSIENAVIDTSKKIFTQQITNGVDNKLTFTIDSSGRTLSLAQDYVIKGKIWNQSFKICISGERYLKEFYLEDQLVCVANGDKALERFVILDESISNSLLNALLMIGFNSYLQ